MQLRLGRVFVIGGAEVYAQALRMEETRRVLLTRVRGEFECDTFFPLRLAEDDGIQKGDEGVQDSVRWVRASKRALDAFAGEEVPAGVQRENGVEWEFEMWEKRSVSSGEGV
ncbi:MAG: hypothetical protein LQ340_007521 [Diploschistes diacapsis]|nr:MAG: hypothetical protein LQ340_007521 [Diploschistes diacapsis]